MKQLYMICYDIRDDWRRNRLIRELLKVGVRVQYSVFECVLTEKTKKSLQRRITEIINKEEDSIYFYPLTENTYKKTLRIGSNISYLPIHDIFI